MADNDDLLLRPATSDNPGGEVEELLARYVERLTEGELLDPDEIRDNHPAVAEALLTALEAFVDAGLPLDQEAPLGTLGDYTLRRQIGRGGMGVVYEAWENSMDRSVALKVLPSALAADNKAYVRFLREARAAGQLSHQNVAHVYAIGVKEQVPYYAMELVEGETLAQLVGRVKDADEETLTPFGNKGELAFYSNVARAFAGVADGLQHAHSKGVVHRDVKPSNLILDQEGRLRILDFGLAHFEGQESLTTSGDIVGTPLYMSPEQARRRKIPVDHRTDVYSLGATLYEMLTWRPPFKGKDHQDTLSQIIERDPVEPRKSNPRVPKDLETIVLKCLRKDPGDRYGTAEALAQDLRRFVRGAPIEARPQGTWGRLWRRARRHRTRLIVSAILFSLVVASSALLYTLWIDARAEARLEFEAAVIEAATKLPRGELLLAEGPHTILRTPHNRDFLADFARALMEEAIDQLTKAIEEFPQRFEGYYCRARALELLGRDAEAAEDLRAALRCKPGFVPARTLLTDVLEERRPPGEMGRDVLAARDGWSPNWVRAQQAVKARRWDEAVAAYGELIAEDEVGAGLYLGSSLDLYLRRGIVFLESRKFEEARHDFWGAHVLTRRTRPGAVEPLLLVGIAYCIEQLTSREQLVEKANDYFEAAYERSAKKDEVALWIARLHEAFCNHKRALVWAKRVTTLEQPRSRLEVSIYLGLGRYEKAVEAARTLTRSAQDDTAALGLLSQALLRRFWVSVHCPVSNTERASLEDVFEFLGVAEKIDSAALRDPSVHLLLSHVCRHLGETERAHEFSESAERILGQSAAERKSASPDYQPESVAFAFGEGYFVEEGPLDYYNGINSPFLEFGPSISPDGRRLYFISDRPDKDSGSAWNTSGYDLYVATWDGEVFGNVTRLDELNSVHNELGPHVSPDGRELYFTSFRAGSFDIYRARWNSAAGEFGSPEPLDEINTPDYQEGGAVPFPGRQGAILRLPGSSRRPSGRGPRSLRGLAAGP